MKVAKSVRAEKDKGRHRMLNFSLIIQESDRKQEDGK